MTCRHDERLDDDEWKSGRNEWKREGRNGCVCCVLRVCVSERIQRGGEGKRRQRREPEPAERDHRG